MPQRELLRYAALALVLAGCGEKDDPYDDARARGDLGVGEFVYGCFNETDLTCTDDDDGALPLAIAVTGRFDLRFDIKSGAQPTVIAPASDFVRAIDGGFQIRAPGQFALLAVNGNREVVDIKHLRGAEVDEVRVQEEGDDLATAVLRLDRRQSSRILAVPYDSRGVKLGGALSYSWSSSDDAIVTIETLSALNRVRVRAGGKPGKATLQVSVAGKTFNVEVQVRQSEAPSEDAGAGLDAGIDGGADAEVDANAEAGSDGGADAESEGGTP